MNVKHIYIWSGYLSVAIGIVATACIFRIQFLKLGVGLAMAGLILSLINIFLNAKYYGDQERIPRGYFGMFLSSLPVIFLMLVIFKFQK